MSNNTILIRNNRKLEVLVVDDDDDARGFFCEDLYDINDEILEVELTPKGFSDSNSILEYLKKSPKEVQTRLIFIDFRLNDEIGSRQLVKKLANYKFPIVIFSGRDIKHAKEEFSSAYTVFQKTDGPEDLKAIIHGILDYDYAFHQAARELEKISCAEGILIYKFDRNQNIFVLSGKCSRIGVIEYSDYINRNIDFFIDELLKKKEPYFLQRKDTLYHENKNIASKSNDILRIPLVSQEKIEGFIDGFFEYIPINEDKQIDIIKIISNKLLDSIRSNTLATYQLALQGINETLALTPGGGPEFYKLILDVVGKHISPDCAWIYTINKKNRQLTLKSNFGLDKKEIQQVDDRTINDGITGKVIKEKRFKYIKNKEAIEKFKGHKKIVKRTCEAVAGIPLKRGSEVIGILTLRSKTSNFLNDDDIQFLRSIATVVAAQIGSEKWIDAFESLNDMPLRGNDFLNKNDKKSSFKELTQFVVDTVKELTGAEVNFWKVGDELEKGIDKITIINSTDSVPYKVMELINKPDKCLNARIFSNHKYPLKREDGTIVINIKEENKALFRDDNKEIYQFLETLEFKGFLFFSAIPIIGNEKEPIGVISLYSKQVIYDSAIEVVTTFVRNVSKTLQIYRKTNAFQLLAKASQRLKRITENTKNHKDAAKNILEEIKKLSVSDGVILIYDRNKQILKTGETKKAKNVADLAPLNKLVKQYGTFFIHDIDNTLSLPKHFHIKSKSKEKAFLEDIKDVKTLAFIQENEIKAIAAIPLLYLKGNGESEKRGIIYVFHKKPKYFNSFERIGARLHTNLVANVLRDISHQLTLETLFQSGLNINKGSNAKTISYQILEELKGLIGYSYATIQEIKSIHSNRVILAEKGNHRAKNNYLLRPVANDKLIEKIYNEQRPIILRDINNLSEEEKKLWSVELETEMIKSWACAPLIDNGEVVGILTLDHEESNYFTEDDKDKLQLFSAQAVVAISRTKQKPWVNLGQIAGALAHSIGNKGSIVRLDIQHLRELIPSLTEGINENIEKKLNSISKNNQYFLDLSEELLRPTRALRDMTPINLGIILETAVAYSNIPEGYKIIPAFKEKLTDVIVDANHSLVEVFAELISNSIHAMKNSPEKILTIESSISKKEKTVSILFADTGMGLSDKDKESIFGLFSSKSGNGNGFGLWWIKTFLDNIGGQIEVSTEKYRQGVTFKIILPILQLQNLTK